ncbi:PREDICTED: phytochrome E [Tarenaya hassleriana]|uniref:phytochrome E n=1 Tax=Tarenaya hassleriana TaxID=28532 RepID=UPI00053C9C3A|nr:PREDICTED: phytochrome E [Tarenaya hassleriana]
MGFDDSASATSNMKPVGNSRPDRNVAQYTADAGILAEFDQSNSSGKSFDYSKWIISPPLTVSDEQITAYLSKIQRGGFVQPFGCMLAVEESGFRILGCSENCVEMLDLCVGSSFHGSGFEFKDVKGLIGSDARALFEPSSGASLAKAASFADISLLNPILVHSRTTLKPFHAILHRIDVGIVIDLEPTKSGDPASMLAGAVQSQKLAVRAISRLQSLSGGDIGALCDTVVEDVQRLTGYDRVMVYKFHEDDHGEVVSEIRRSDLEPYMGLHYPATDIPQAARFLFRQNRVRMICDCRATPVRIIQSEELDQAVCLVNSTLRSPHSCHTQYMANMGSIASLVLAVMIKDKDLTKLWGLVVGHHTSPKYVAFPIRYACEFLMQAFGLQLHMELQLAARLAEKKVLKTQTLLCEMLLRDTVSAIVTQSPSIMDIVKCDGAALYYKGKCWLAGVTPNESQVKDLVNWMLENHGDSTGLTTVSLVDAGYGGAASLGDAVCGMASARISLDDFLFWFRSHTADEIQWGGAKHQLLDKDDAKKMQPRSSFRAFLEVVKRRSLPWEISEINAIHSLQVILRETFQNNVQEGGSGSVSGLMPSDAMVKDVNKLTSFVCEMVRLIETATAPIFGVNSSGCINGWNPKVSELTGLLASEAMGKSLTNHIVRSDSGPAAETLLSRALQGEEDKNVMLKLRRFRNGQPDSSAVCVLVNACTSRDYTNKIIGVCFVGQDLTGEKTMTDKFIRLQGDYRTIFQSPNPLIPPIFGSDENACCSEWNAAMEKLTGWPKHEVIGKMLPGEVFGGICKVKDPDSLTKVQISLYRGITGQGSEKSLVGFFSRDGKYLEAFLTAIRRTNAEGNKLGCFFFLQTIDRESDGSWQENKENLKSLNELVYICQEIKNPLNGIRFAHKLLEATDMSENQKRFLEDSYACERQIATIIEGTDTRNIQERKWKMKVEEFFLGRVLDTVISQVKELMDEKNLQLELEVPEWIKALPLYGDRVWLQLILTDFLRNSVNHTPFPDGWVKIKISSVGDSDHYISLQFRMIHPGKGIPSETVSDMFEGGGDISSSPDGLGLNFSRKLLERMNGRVNYVREQDTCYFCVDLQLRTAKEEDTDMRTEAGSSKIT